MHVKLRSHLIIGGVALGALSGAWGSSRRDVPQGAASGETAVVGESWNVCTWFGPSIDRRGIFGSDLGFEAPLPAASDGASHQMQLLFGDTYTKANDACKYLVTNQDDLAVRVPRVMPASLSAGEPAGGSDACATQYPLDDAKDATSWRRIRVFPDASDHEAVHALDTGLTRTPMAGWSDGTHAFAVFYRDEFARCDSNADCPGATICSSDPAYRGKQIGGCIPRISLSSDASPLFCRKVDGDCQGLSWCADLDRGVCIADAPFNVVREGQELHPDWYDSDPREGVVSHLLVASSFWPERPEDYATGSRFITNKFMNLTARTVTHFDPDHPEQNDYSPGNETLLVWGRPSFTGHDGFQALSFFLYQPLQDFIDGAGKIAWSPRFFAGYDALGNPAWSATESDAQPIYGVDENLSRGSDGRWRWNWQYPEFDYVNQVSMTFVEPLQRWIMLYGGETPAIADRGSAGRPQRTHPQSIRGAVHLRAASHPWGRARAHAPASTGYGQPRPVLTPAAIAKHIACEKDHPKQGECNADLPQTHNNVLDSLKSAVTDFSSGDIVGAIAKCVGGGESIDLQFRGEDEGGHLYGVAIMQSWTQDVTADLTNLTAGDRAVELYWNVSTWNPYQALLMKTQLRASDFGDH
jgi:hypothetical protein